MKNIQLLPTDKPSRLGYLTKKGKEVFNDLRLFEKPMPNILDSENQNIYITSDEEIKIDEYYIHGNRLHKHLGKKCLDVLTNKEYPQSNLINKDSVFKKVILSTDLELQKDGVQSIPDDFLEWFVKNPSCEEVEVKKYHGIKTSIAEVSAISGNDDYKWEGRGDFRDYKIIIPKEESKQTVQEYEQQGLEKYSYESEPKQETIYEYTENYKPSFVDLTDILPKKETLEEVAETELRKQNWDTTITLPFNGGFIEGFQQGAKWYKELYQEEIKLLKEELEYEKHRNVRENR